MKVVAFDKTGTLTGGKPGVTDIVSIAEVNDETVLALAAATEIRSEHHLAKAIVQAAQQAHLSLPKATGFQALLGRGARAFVAGQEIRVGKPAMFTAKNGGIRANDNDS